MSISLKDFKITEADLPLKEGWSKVKIVGAELKPSSKDKKKINLVLSLDRNKDIYIPFKGYDGFAYISGKQRLASISNAVGITDFEKLEDTDQLLNKPFYVRVQPQASNPEYTDVVDFISEEVYLENEELLLAQEEERKANLSLKQEELEDVDF